MKNGLYCSGGYNWFSVGSEGRISVCNEFLYRNNSACLGNIITDDIVLRKDKFEFRCPTQKCEQMCDRHWAKKKIYKDDIEIDSDNPDESFSILFAPTWKCNFSCKYCGLPKKRDFPSIPNACDEHLPEKWIERFSKFFDINNIRGGLLQFTGGEPLYYDGIDKLFSFFHTKHFKIALTTNLTGDIYKNIISCTKPDYFNVLNCSLHPLDRNFNWPEFKNGVQLLKLMGYNVGVNFVGHPNQLTLASEYDIWCKSIGVNFSLIPLIGKVDTIIFNTINDYPEPLRNIIHEFSSIKLQDNNRFKDGKRLS